MKRLLILLISLLALPLSYSMSFDDFADSYDYTYDLGRINVTDIKIKDCEEPCLNFTMIIETNSESGDYSFFGYLDNKASSRSQYLFGVDDIIELIFYPPFENNPSDFLLKISNNDELVYYKNLDPISISSITYQSPVITVNNDFESDGKLLINLSVESSAYGEYYVKGYLENNGDVFVSKQNVVFDGKKDLLLEFNPYNDGVYTLISISLNKSIIPINYKTDDYSLSKIEIVSDNITNGDLILEFEIKQGFAADIYLFDEFSNLITSAVTNNETAIFNGSKINESGINGPYAVKAIVDGHSYEYITKYYDYAEFGFDEEATKEQSVEDEIESSDSKQSSSSGGGIIDKITSFFSNSTENKTEESINEPVEFDMYKKTNTKDKEENDPPKLDNGTLSNLLTGNIIGNKYGKSNLKSGLSILGMIFIIIMILLSVYYFKRNF